MLVRTEHLESASLFYGGLKGVGQATADDLIEAGGTPR